MKKIISILTLSAVGIIGVAISDISSNTYALSYSDNIGVNFTFDQSLTVSLSSADIVINNLAPGSSSDSNIIDINVLSNNLSGYTLTSTVGNNSTYSNTNLTYTSSASVANAPTFTSLSTSDSISSLDDFDDNTWGYAYSTDSNTWSNYGGLPKYNDTTNVATLRTSTGPSSETGDDTYFKIAAKASTTQPSGEYRNVINFTVTAEHNPVSFYDAFKEAATKDPTITTLNGYYKMQDMTADICNTIEAEESQMTLIDTRDHNVYTVAKLKDNRCWMTTNLNLKGGTQLSSEDTDIPEGYTLPVANGFQEGNRLPESSASGFDDDATAYLYNSGRNATSYCSEAPGCYGYYSWTAATAGSGVSISADDTDAPYSICPKNWRMPTTRSGTNSTADFRVLAIALGGSSDLQTYTKDTTPTGNAMASSLRTNPYNFVATGVHDATGYQSRYANFGFYWSATSANGSHSKYLQIDAASYVYFAQERTSRAGFAVRCLADNK